MIVHPSNSPHTAEPGAVPRVVALTGGIGCGKSMVGKIFAELGAPYLDADLVARHIHQDATHPATLALAHAFPAAVSADGKLARGSLRQLFADDGAANEELKRILKPFVLAEVMQWASEQNLAYVVVESALALDQAFAADRVLVVDAPEEIRIARIRARNPDWTANQIEMIMAMQWSRAAFLAAAQDVLINDGSIEALKKAVENLHQQYTMNWN